MPVIRPMSDEEYATWVAETVPAYAKEKVESGAWTAAESLEKSKAELETLLPDGRGTKDHYLYTVLSEGGEAVGVLWFAEKLHAETRIAYLYNIKIHAEHRRRGHAQRALRALEAEVGRLGLAGIALHVFGHNTSAQALYTRLGYVPTNINMYKRLQTGA